MCISKKLHSEKCTLKNSQPNQIFFRNSSCSEDCWKRTGYISFKTNKQTNPGGMSSLIHLALAQTTFSSSSSLFDGMFLYLH